MTYRALALDLGSTRLKLAVMQENGSLKLLANRAFPCITGSGGFREADPHSFLDRVEALFANAAFLPRATPLGISAQRSSFLLWDRNNGKPLSRIISWQDRRAHHWCLENAALMPMLWRLTGLPFSPHYAGPKLAYLLAKDRWLAAIARAGDACFGTLETYLAWHWSGGTVFQTDPGMAARTQLVAVEDGAWSPEILDTFSIPETMLPKILPFSQSQVTAPGGWKVQEVVPDQSAAVLPIFKSWPNAGVLNAGTGSFVLRQALGRAPDGFLTVRINSSQLEGSTALWEGPINAGASVWHQWNTHLESGWQALDGQFAAAEEHGWAAPYWRGDLSQSCTDNHLPLSEKAGLFMEGYAFRVREVIMGLFPQNPPEPLLVGGGLSHDHAWLCELASYLPWTLYQLEQAELSLWGAAWLADHCHLTTPRPPTRVTAGGDARRMQRFSAWSTWMASKLVG